MKLGIHKINDVYLKSNGYPANDSIVVNDALDLAMYDDVSNDMMLWHSHGSHLVGKIDNFGDWMALRLEIMTLIEIKTLVDYSQYNTLSANEKHLATVYVPTKIVDNLGYQQLVIDSGSISEAGKRIDRYIINSKEARNKRYLELIKYAYSRLGKSQGLLAEEKVRNNNLHEKYKDRGVLKKLDDNVDGLEDYLRATDSFAATGLKLDLDNVVYALINDGSGQTNQQFIDKCVSIIELGAYSV